MIFEKIRKKLKEESFIDCSEYYLDDGGRLISINEAIKIINQIEDEYKNDWISVHNRLPEKYGDYLCRDKQNNLTIGYPINNSMSYTGYAVETDNEIVYNCVEWKPLSQ